MNNGELKQRLRDLSHRTDLEGHLQTFINAASNRINNRSGYDLGDMFEDTDSNVIIANHHLLYEYAAMRELSIQIKDWEEGVRFDDLFDKEISRMDIHSNSDDWVTNNTELTYIRTPAETAALLEE